MADLSRAELQRLASLGARARLEEIRQEEAAIRRAFPGLVGGRRHGKDSKTAGATPRRRRRRMSAAARKAVSERMTRYWAARRRAKGKK